MGFSAKDAVLSFEALTALHLLCAVSLAGEVIP